MGGRAGSSKEIKGNFLVLKKSEALQIERAHGVLSMMDEMK